MSGLISTSTVFCGYNQSTTLVLEKKMLPSQPKSGIEMIAQELGLDQKPDIIVIENLTKTFITIIQEALNKAIGELDSALDKISADGLQKIITEINMHAQTNPMVPRALRHQYNTKKDIKEALQQVKKLVDTQINKVISRNNL